MRYLPQSIAYSLMILLVASSANSAWAQKPQPTESDGLTALERIETYGTADDNRVGIQGVARDLIITDTTRRNMFFGLYRLSQLNGVGWDLFDQGIDWVNNSGDPATTKVWLATYNGSLDPSFSAEKDGIAAYGRLLNELGFAEANIHVDGQTSIENANFTGYDIVIYAHTYPRDASNVLNQGMPFFTICAAETDEMGIGTGDAVMHESRDFGYVLDNDHQVTSGFAPGKFTLDVGMWMDASIASDYGRVLVTADDSCLYLGVSNLAAGSKARFDVTGVSDGSYLAVVYGTNTGTTGINNYLDFCATFDIAGVNANKVVDRGLVNGGLFAGRKNIPNGYAGINLYFQAARRDTCPDECMSNLVNRTIR